MSIVYIDNKHCFNIANAIRAVKGTTAKIKFSKMAEEIKSIKTEGGSTTVINTPPCSFIGDINNSYVKSTFKMVSIPIVKIGGG